MKKLITCITLLLASGLTYSQGNPVIRGEVSPGVYANVAVDAFGNLVTSGSSSGATTGSKLGGTAASMSELAGAIYVVTKPTLTDGQQKALGVDARGNLDIRIVDSTGTAGAAVAASTLDAVSAGVAGLYVNATNRVFNGTTWDRQRGDTTGTYVVPRPTPGVLINRSGAITTGGTAQAVMGANTSRIYLLIQNVSDTAMWCNFGVTAVAGQPSISIIPGASFIMENTAISTEAVSCIGATAGKQFTAKEM